MTYLVKNCPTQGLTTWMVIQTFYAGLNFTSRNMLDSAAGGTFMSTTLGAATKLLDEIMMNYSQWHTERYPTRKKVNSVEEISSLNEKVDLIMSLLTKQAPIDPNDVPLNSLVAQEQVDVNLSLGTTSTTMLIGVILVTTILDRSHPTTMGTTALILAPKTPLLNKRVCLRTLSVPKKPSTRV